MSSKIAFFEIPVNEEEYIRNRLGTKHDLFFFREELTAQHLAKISDIEILSVFIYSRITKDVLNQLANLKLIATRSTGYDHIDLEACRDRQILVSNVPHYGENTVAEHTFGLILALSRNIHRGYMRTIQRNFS
ncbi:MAG: hydroxyacid dehydrogenase, partial [Calditrichaeota bacterium]